MMFITSKSFNICRTLNTRIVCGALCHVSFVNKFVYYVVVRPFRSRVHFLSGQNAYSQLKGITAWSLRD